MSSGARAVRPRVVLLVALLLVAAGAVYVAGRQSASPVSPYEVQRLGPEPGERVADYLARIDLPAQDAGPVWALVQLTQPVSTGAAAALVAGVRLSRVVFRVPLPRVQTALVTRDVPGQRPATELADAQRLAADDRSAAATRAAAAVAATPGTGTSTGTGATRTAEDAAVVRAAAVAAAEAAALRSGCACVLALLVHADRAALTTLTASPSVRALHAADPSTPLHAVAVSPLLPEQTEVAGPVPDDGPIPAVG